MNSCDTLHMYASIAGEQISIIMYDSSEPRVEGMGIYDINVSASQVKYDFDVSYLPSGIYCVQATIGSRSELKKIVD